MLNLSENIKVDPQVNTEFDKNQISNQIKIKFDTNSVLPKDPL